MEIVLAVLIIAVFCFAPSGLYLWYTSKRPEPFLDRK